MPLPNTTVFFSINRRCGNIYRSCSRDSICLTISIKIISHKNIPILLVKIILTVRLTNDLMIQHKLFRYQTVILTVKFHFTPVISVEHAVSVVPAGVVFIPTHVFFVGFNVNGDTSDAVEGLGIHLNVLAENDGFQGEGHIAGRSEILINIMRWHFGDNKSFEIGCGREATTVVCPNNSIFEHITIPISTVGNTYNTFPDFHVPYVLVNTDKMISYI